MRKTERTLSREPRMRAMELRYQRDFGKCESLFSLFEKKEKTNYTHTLWQCLSHFLVHPGVGLVVERLGSFQRVGMLVLLVVSLVPSLEYPVNTGH